MSLFRQNYANSLALDLDRMEVGAGAGTVLGLYLGRCLSFQANPLVLHRQF